MSRPKFELQPGVTDRVLDWLSIALLAAFWIITFVTYPGLPEKVPAHYNFKGEVDRWDSKIFVIVLPIIATGLYSLLYFLNKRPHIFNYPVSITEENAEQQYRMATRMIRVLSLLVILLLCWIQVQSVLIAVKGIQPTRLGWQLPVLILLIPVFVVAYVIKATSAAKKVSASKRS